MLLIIAPEKGLTLATFYFERGLSSIPFKIESRIRQTDPFDHYFGRSSCLLSFGDSAEILSDARLTSVIMNLFLVSCDFASSFWWVIYFECCSASTFFNCFTICVSCVSLRYFAVFWLVIIISCKINTISDICILICWCTIRMCYIWIQETIFSGFVTIWVICRFSIADF